MQGLKPKKSLGQHFLRDENIARKIIGLLPSANNRIIEIGPGEGVLTKYLIEGGWDAYFIDTDREAVDKLKLAFPDSGSRIIHQDFLKADLHGFFQDDFILLGNLPYNISSQIFFKALEYRSSVQFMLFMIQKEVAERIASPPGSKNYGILSVLLQAYYEIDYLFTVNETVFYPRPRVKSAVVRLERKDQIKLDCDEKLFFKVVKTAFNQRRKTLRNALKPMGMDLTGIDPGLLNQRAEQLNLEDFVYLTSKL